MRSILLQLHVGRPEQCVAWENIPTAHGVQITVYANQGISPRAEACARNCFAMLERSLIAIGGIKDLAPCMKVNGHIWEAYTCAGAVNGLHKRLLIYIADNSAFVDPSIASYFLQQNSVVIPVVDGSLGSNFQRILPIAFSTIVSQVITNFDPAPIIPRIMRAVGILTKGFRLFISYRHLDAAPLASQLFHVLSERMFDVFLDRFSSRTGDDFVSLVREELFDKACLLVLETPGIGQSVYCRQEVSTAVFYNLGLLAVDLPGSINTFPEIIKRLDLSGVSLSGGVLNDSNLQLLIEFIEKHYDSEIARRLRAQDQSLFNSIMAAHLPAQALGVGQYRVQKNGREYLLTMSSCPPGVEDFIEVEALAQQPSPARRTLLFGPISVVRTFRAQQISWLGDKSAVEPIDEGHLLRSITSL